ncbi:MAG: hypothetical protein EXR28_13465 [Betaproteobacteria bacterium]|nr:hypothetical protein [Betaproteobacteria bacterium]
MPQKVVVIDTNKVVLEEFRRGRVHMIRAKRMSVDTGVPGVHVEFSYSVVPDGYFTPSHRHNIDQIRYTLRGLQSTGHGDLAPGECGYFPEGVHYGPQKQVGDCECLVLQFQGPSGHRFLSNEEMNTTYNKMIAAGARFENGVYTGAKPDGTKINKDSYEAIWEEHEGRELVFPRGRYRAPVMMVAENFRWVRDLKRPGVETRHMGAFSEMRTEIGMLRLNAGAAIDAGLQPEAEIRYLLEGVVRYAGQTWPAGSYFYLPHDSSVESLSTDQGAKFFTITLPMLAYLDALAAQSKSGAAIA